MAYEARFAMPTLAMDAPWYSFDFGVVHFVMISTEHAFAPVCARNGWTRIDARQSSDQYNFVVADLAAIDRSATPWVVFAGHRPYVIDSTNWAPDSGDQVWRRCQHTTRHMGRRWRWSCDQPSRTCCTHTRWTWCLGRITIPTSDPVQARDHRTLRST